MSKTKLHPYAIRVIVQPKPDGITKYGAKSFKGVALAKNPAQAKELAINIVLDAFADHDGSSIVKPIITRDELTVKECKLYGDFITKPE